ncbi:hypothetical protein E1176_11015 [Fulvivirga sp. RKSG066]|uniref:TPM domain-containing protein n=1 Tax=Fulvivirga aurantia TaxID=2529383 RepID=UPI0012BC97DF|nr:hypothetical protein [Fulvivirga aurantia]MTI21549.1 hypothetical protein [Fulvivirga aurantia]
MSSKKFRFSESQKKQIKEAIIDLESHSSGEIVPYFAERSDDYEEARWKSAIIFSLFGAILLGLSSYFWLLPFVVTPLEDAIYIAILMIAGFVFPILFPASIRFLLNDNKLHRRVMESATEVFLEEEIFKTRDRTGVLIYISELEHEVVVLADSGINAKVAQHEWEAVANLIIAGVKNKKVEEGLIKAIHKCKDLLLENGFHAKDNDSNELSDNVRFD